MNFIAKAFAILGVATSLGLFSLASASHSPTHLMRLRQSRVAPFASFEANEAIQPTSPVAQLNAPRLISQLADKVDLTLLAKASANFLQSDRVQTESEIQVKATSGSTSVTSTAKATTIAQAPNKFRTELVFADSGNAQKPDSIVISDGKRVWIYRPGLKQYAITSYDKFDQVDDNYWVGMSSLWFLEIPAQVRKSIAQGALSDPKVQQQLGLPTDLAVKGSTETVNGQELYVYEYLDKEGFSIRAFVDPQTAALQQVVLTGKSDGFDVVITERILRRVTNPSINASTFQTSPHLGAKQVKTLAIGPL
jgi:outer membrane lipoprotein-sorting protein